MRGRGEMEWEFWVGWRWDGVMCIGRILHAFIASLIFTILKGTAGALYEVNVFYYSVLVDFAQRRHWTFQSCFPKFLSTHFRNANTIVAFVVPNSFVKSWLRINRPLQSIPVNFSSAISLSVFSLLHLPQYPLLYQRV